MKDIVKAWEDDIIIPTYRTGAQEKNPIFLEKRVYQGSSGTVYPYPIIEKIFDQKEDKVYRAVFLENDYLKIMILPEIGGRIQMAYDKINQRHFVYYNRVIKPALVGLTGPWISGGIEFNWPQHHRPGTFLKVDHCIEEFPDGSKTIWCSEVERISRTKGMTGFTLYPGHAYLEVKVKLFNRTPLPQTFLWWANPALKANDEYQSVFPPDVNAVYDHGKRDVSAFPVARGKYYKVDYSSGVDISRYKNIPVPTSYMAIQSDYDFVGGYEHDTDAGMLHVADHHISPGKKQWTWGTGDFGKAWERNLTDEDGPYIELMTGVFTDNQPDFSWIMPMEERSFEQYFMPYTKAGLVKNATKNAAVNVEIEGKSIDLWLYATSEYNGAVLNLKAVGEQIFCSTINISPRTPYMRQVKTGRHYAYSDLSVALTDCDGHVLVQWNPGEIAGKTLPEPAKPARQPGKIESIEQLFLTGMHIEQYRHATFRPDDYYLEGLNREPGDIRCNNAMGLWLLKHGKVSDAEAFFRKAIDTLTERNPNPYDGEPFYNLGYCLKLQGRNEEAYKMFYKAVWNAAWQDSGYFSLAQIAAGWGRYDEALIFTEKSLIRNSHNHKCRHLKTALARIQGSHQYAFNYANESLELDKFNIGCLFEKYLSASVIRGDEEPDKILRQLKTLTNGSLQTKIEFALDYMAAGLYTDAREFLLTCFDEEEKRYPMIIYMLGYLDHKTGIITSTESNYKKAQGLNTNYCFPNRYEEIIILNDALSFNPEDDKALYYSGNYWYSNMQYDDAFAAWEKAASINSQFPAVLRNLALVWYNKKRNPGKALELLENAFNLDKTDSRILMELDQLYKRTGQSLRKRLELLESNLQLVEFRDDLFLERVTLYNQAGNFSKADQLIKSRTFHPWEGGEGKVIKQYIICRLGLAITAIKEHDYARAIELLMSALSYPENLGEGKLYGTLENNIFYYLGYAYEKMDDQVSAKKYFKLAASGDISPSQACFYNDQPSDMIFYQGLAMLKLGKIKEAKGKFNMLIDYGKENINKIIRIDYFAVSLPDLLIWEDDLSVRNNINCNYLTGLGFLGKGKETTAIKYFSKVLNKDRFHTETLFQLEHLK